MENLRISVCITIYNEKKETIKKLLDALNTQTLKPDEIIIKTTSGEQKLLFLSDNFYPGWKAKVDGVGTEILRADYTFRAVPLIPGEHEVVFYFDSDTFKIGVLISLIGIMSLSLILLCLIYFRRRLDNILAEDI